MAKLPTLRKCRLDEITIIMNKDKNNFAPSYTAELFNNNLSCYALRNADFVMPRRNTVTHGKHSLRYIEPKLWAKLGKDIRKAENQFYLKVG